METLGYEATLYSPMLGNPGVDLERQLRAAAAAGFSWFAVDTWSIDGFLASGRELEELRDIADDCGLECGQLQTLGLPFPQPAEPFVRRFAEAARVLQPGTVQVICATHTDDTVRAFRAASEQVRAVAPEAVFAIEYLPMRRVNTIEAALGFARETGVEGFGLNLDTWHFFIGPEDWDDLYALAPEDIVHLQFCDHGPLREPLDLLDETVNRRLLPGDGDFDLARFFEVVRAKGYAGRAGVEVLSAPLRALPPEEYVVEAHRAGTRFWARP